MTKKRLILTKEQVERISEGEGFVYLSNLSSKPDMGDIYSTEITTNGSIENGYPIPTTTDDKADSMTCDWRGNAKLAGMGASTVRECSKKEWLQNNICNEESEHGNARLKTRKFGAMNGEQGKSYAATKMANSRKKKAEEKLNSTDPNVRASGIRTLQKMHQNWDALDIATSQYEGAKLSDSVVQQNKIGPKIKSAPKESGNGKAHSPKNGVFLN